MYITPIEFATLPTIIYHPLRHALLRYKTGIDRSFHDTRPVKAKRISSEGIWLYKKLNKKQIANFDLLQSRGVNNVLDSASSDSETVNWHRILKLSFTYGPRQQLLRFNVRFRRLRTSRETSHTHYNRPLARW